MGKKGYSASYTVEATYMMAIVLVVLAMLITVSYDRCQEVTGMLRLHHVVCQLRGEEEIAEQEFAVGQKHGYVKRGESRITGNVGTGERERSIEMKLHEPEEVMRRKTILELFQSQPREESQTDEGR